MTIKGRPRKTAARPVRTLASAALARCGADYLADCRARNFSRRTVEHYARALELLAASLPAGVQWDTPSAVRQAVAALQEHGYSKASLSMYLRAWRSFLNFCKREELVSEGLARYIRPPKTEPRRETILVPRDVERLLRAAADSATGMRDVAILTLLFDTGLRAGEVCALMVANVDLGAHVMTVPTGKTGGRSVPIGRTTTKALRAWLRVHPTGDGPLFPSARTGKPLRANSLFQRLTVIGKRAGIDTHPHQWRHSFAVNYLKYGGDVFTLQRILGHSTLVMSRWYATLNDADVQARHEVASPADRLGERR